MNSESIRIADQLRRAFAGDAWHGPSLYELISTITAEQASARPLPSAHNIWELVLHIDVWTQVAFEATQGTPMPKIDGTEKDWTIESDGGEPAWTHAKDSLFRTGAKLAKAMEEFDDSRLQEIVPGRDYDFYRLFHGIVQHSLYHGGQIAMLARALRPI